MAEDARARATALLDAGKAYEALAAAAFSMEPRGSALGLERALSTLAASGLVPSGSERERLLWSVVGDAWTLVLRFDRAAQSFANAQNQECLQRLHALAVAFGRYRAVRELESKHPELRLEGAARRRFLLERALPQAPIGGDTIRGFAINEEVLRQIAADLGEPLEALLAQTVERLRQAGSRHVAKMYVLARLSGNTSLAESIQPLFDTRAAAPRAQLEEWAREAVAPAGGRITKVLRAGDCDDYNPVSAWLFRGELDGAPVVLKEHLRLPVDYARIDGYSDERHFLETIAHPDVVKLVRTFEIRGHELMALEWVAGRELEEHTTEGSLLPASQALSIVARLARLLAHLHSQGIVYLDVKAKNVLYDGQRFKLVDFGMAQRLRQGETMVTSLPSTAAYCPPEMARGFAVGTPGDVFQLGIVLYQLLVGRHPFATEAFLEGDDERESELIRYSLANLWCEPSLDAPPLDAPGLRGLLRSMLDRRPQSRPTAAEVAERLGEMR